MIYKEVVFTLTSGEDFYRDLLIQDLAEAGFDTFEETETGFKAYIPQNAFDEKVIEEIISRFGDDFTASFIVNDIEQKNWNEVWEGNFEPIYIGNNCYVRAPFHQPHPEYPYEIVIEPKMAFGTGHHQTTALMMEFLLEEELSGKTVLDMGCGTGILAILADKLHAREIIAIDYDPVCYESTRENAQLNKSENIIAICGSAEAIPAKKFDLILANINRNILLEQFAKYAEVINQNGTLLISGFYEADLPALTAKAVSLNFEFVQSKVLQNWVAAKFKQK